MYLDWRLKISRAVETTGFAVVCAFAAKPIMANQSNLRIEVPPSEPYEARAAVSISFN
jgi:hypothetical protein